MVNIISTLVLAIGLPAVIAQTFSELTPGTSNPLVVEFVGNASGSTFVSNAANLSADRVSAAPFIGLTGNFSGNHVLMMVDTDVITGNSSTKTTILHYFQTDLNVTSTGSNYTRLASPSNIPAVYPYLTPGPPAGQIHRYTLLLFPQPSTLTAAIVGAAFKSAFAASGKDRVGFNIANFQQATEIKAPIASRYFEFGSGMLTTGTGMNLNASIEFRGDAGEKTWVERSVFAWGLGIGAGLMAL